MIPIYKPTLDKEEMTKVRQAMESGWISSKGEFITEFEQSFSGYIGKKYGVTTSNGTTALHLALSSLNCKKGDEVIVPDFTFVSPVNVVLYQGAKPVLVDVEMETWGMDPNLIEKKITKKTKAIIAVHIYGNSAKIDEIREIAEDNNLFLIEDCAESIGAKYNGSKVGTRGVISCFSFYGNKVITTGEGGMCLTDNNEINKKMRLLRDHGMSASSRYWHDFVGYNYRMTNIQAAIGLAQFSKLEKIIRRKKEIARLYTEFLTDFVEVQRDPGNAEGVFWLFSILAKNKKMRETYESTLTKANIESRPFFNPVHVMPPYRRFCKKPSEMKNTVNISDRGINLPSYPELSDEQIKTISDVIRYANY